MKAIVKYGPANTVTGGYEIIVRLDDQTFKVTPQEAVSLATDLLYIARLADPDYRGRPV